MGPFDELEEQDDLSSIFQKYDADRNALNEANSGYDFAGRTAAALSAIGAGFSGRDPGAALNASFERQRADKDRQISALDKWKQAKLQEIQAKREGVKATREDEKYAREQSLLATEDDPNSDVSKAYQESARKMVPSMNFQGKSATELSKLLPTLKSLATLEVTKRKAAAGKADRGRTKGFDAADTAFGKDYADYEAGGGKASVSKNIEELGSAIKELGGGAGSDRSGGLSGLFGDTALETFNPQAAMTRDKIRSAIQGSLKQILGGQFTQQEAEAMFNRAYNPRFSNEQNIAKAQAELQALQEMAKSKEAAGAYFRQYGTIDGFKAPSSSVAASSPPPAPNTGQDERGILGINKAHAGTRGYPIQLRKGSQVVDVSDPEEEREARAEGWK